MITTILLMNMPLTHMVMGGMHVLYDSWLLKVTEESICDCGIKVETYRTQV